MSGKSLSLLICFVMLRCSLVAAQTITWNSPVGGLWETAANWSPSEVPVQGDDVLISGTGTGTVTVNADATINSLSLNGEYKLSLLSGKLQLSAVPPRYILSISKAGAGSGTVSSSPSAIECGSTCSAPFEKGSIVTLTASTETDSIFSGWSGGGCTGIGNCYVTMNADTSVTATFAASMCISGTPGQSCNGLATQCQGADCCARCQVPGGTFPMGRGTEDCGGVGCQTGPAGAGCPNGSTCFANEQPEHDVAISTYYLDKYEVTVGRFRKFVEAYDAWRPIGTSQINPSTGMGSNSNVAGNSGWDASWNANLPSSAAVFRDASHLSCDPMWQTWTDTPGANEQAAINCVSWYEAFAFCIWDGGRLPTEAEWEYSSAGGGDNRLYPWGSQIPDGALANYGGNLPGLGVGSRPLGSGRWGHRDLAGGMWEWTLDAFDQSWYSNPMASWPNPANLGGGPTVRAVRGGSWVEGADNLRTANRSSDTSSDHYNAIGFRCATNGP